MRRRNPKPTEEEAAVILGVSPEYIAALLDAGQLPHRRQGGQRCLLRSQVLAFKMRDDRKRDAILDLLVADGQELGLGYDSA